MSSDCCCASALIRRVDRARGRRRRRRRPSPTPTRGASRNAVTRSLVAISVLLGTQSVSTHAPPMPSRSTTVTSRAELRGDQRRLVAGRAAADDHDARHVPIVPDSSGPVPPAPRTSVVCRSMSIIRRPLRGVRLQHGPGADARALPALARRRHGWLNGWRLTFGGEELGWDGALRDGRARSRQPGLRRALRRLAAGPAPTLDYWEGADTGLYNKIQLRVSTLDGDVLAWVYVLDGVRGRAAVGALPRA